MRCVSRNRRCVSVVAMLMAAACPVWADEPAVAGFTIPARTSVPFTYCIWYRPDLDNEAFLKELAASPPDLFHVGYQIPFKGALGPTYGHELFTDDILSPGEISREVDRIKSVMAMMHGAGVERLIPYVYTMAYFGNPVKRTGFFHFFDHWDEYAAFGLGPKPDGDPLLWIQAEGPEPLGGGPPDVLHYQPCVNHPAWSRYLDVVVRQLASAGYDGMFHDVNTEYCFCPHCQEKFRLYLWRKYGRQGLQDAFGSADIRKLGLSNAGEEFEDCVLSGFKAHLTDVWHKERLDRILGVEKATQVHLDEDWRLLRCYTQGSRGEFPPVEGFRPYLAGRFGGDRADKVPVEKRKDFTQTVLRHEFQSYLKSNDLARRLEAKFGSSDVRRRCLTDPRRLLLSAESQRFWSDSMASTLARLKKIGRDALRAQGRTEEFYTVANLGPVATIDCVNKRRVDGIDLVRWATSSDMQMFEEFQQCGTLDSGVILSNLFGLKWAMAAGTRGGTLLYMVNDDRAADLAEAEVAACGGGAFIQPGIGAPESRKRWKTFYREHADLWDNGISCARVGLLYWHDQFYFEYPEHHAMTRRLVNILCESQVPFDIVTEENLGGLGAYQVIIAPSLRYMDTAEMAALQDYADKGGRLLVIEPFGIDDLWARPRESAEDANVGRGQVVRLQPSDVPARASDFWNLMEERANHFVRAREVLNAERRAEDAKGVDRGTAFVRQIEERLQQPLRWCPPETDASVYVHAYKVSAKEGRPERIVVHLVNYHMPILVTPDAPVPDNPDVSPPTVSGEPVEVRDLHVDVPIPKGRQAVRVETLSPAEEAPPASWKKRDNGLALAVPRLRIYQAVVIDLNDSGAPGS